MTVTQQPPGFAGLNYVVEQPLRFKARLGIGEEAYKSLLAGRTVADLWGVGTAAATGGMVAGSSTVASTFFGTWLTALGIGTAVTPVGWVIAASAAVGTLSWGVLRVWRGYSSSRVEVVPRFINTPIDLLAAALFDLIAGLAILVAREAGELDGQERSGITDYFVREWGLSPDYIAAALPVLEETTEGRSALGVAKALASFKRQNPDCNYEIMSEEILRFLVEIGEADGALDDAERKAIDAVHEIFAHENSLGVWAAASSAAGLIAEAPRSLWRLASGAIQSTEKDDDEDSKTDPCQARRLPVPTLWLLGKTGAGKSSLVKALTKAESAEIGNGFVSCTRTARSFDFPAEEPVMRFLDTRGLGEVDYDPTADLATVRATANVALVLLRLDDPVQGAIAKAVKSIRKATPDLPVVVVHTAGDLLASDDEVSRARRSNQAAIEIAWGDTLPWLVLDLADPATADLSQLEAELVKVLPSVVMFLASEAADDEEGAEFLKNRALVLAFAGSATATGVLPIVGAASVPALQLAMLSTLASRYGVEWNAKRLTELASGLGFGIVGGQAIGFVAREAAKFLPVVGQTVVPVAAASWGFASTYALGRVATWWFHKLNRQEAVDPGELRGRFAAAMKGATS